MSVMCIIIKQYWENLWL